MSCVSRTLDGSVTIYLSDCPSAPFALALKLPVLGTFAGSISQQE